jgi:hypothetical protein
MVLVSFRVIIKLPEKTSVEIMYNPDGPVGPVEPVSPWEPVAP